MERIRKGSKVILTDDAVENYGEEYRNKVLTVISISTKYMDSQSFFDKGKPEGYHPGFDPDSGNFLYDFEEIDFALYDWEIKLTKSN